ncbi:MAG: hypothetical protein JXO22_08615 [Phycisphaerae bacterium]|nr:hypothetical protein [Phycisphaerae bacterium]
MSVRIWRKYAATVVTGIVSLVAIVGCPEIGESVSATQNPSGYALFSGVAKTATVSSSPVGGPVDPRKDSTIEVVVYNSDTLPLSAIDITAALMEGERVYETYAITLNMTSFEADPGGRTSVGGQTLTTRYVGTLTTSCAECDPTALLPDTYSWEVTITGTEAVHATVYVYFDYQLYLGPIVSP